MTTQRAIRRLMLQLDPALGRSEAVTALATGSVTAGALAYGGSPQRYVDRYAVRGDATAAADKIRRISNFTPSTGLMAHTGTNYSDTTTTGETVEVWEFDPQLADNGIQITLGRLKHQDRTELPTLQAQRRIWLDDLSWVTTPGDIQKVAWTNNPVLTRNRHFEKWNAYDSSGVLTPDFWTLSGASATMARSMTAFRGQYSAAITRSGTNCLLTQDATVLPNGVSAENLRSKPVTAVAVVQSSVASQVRVQIYDGSTATSSSYHTGGGGWEELSVTATMSATATQCAIRISVETSNTVCYVDEGYHFEFDENLDSIRRDNWEEYPVNPGEWEQAGTLAVTLPERSRRGQWVIYSQRAYPQLDATRFAGNTSEADTIDADARTVATGAIGRLYEALAQGDDRTKYAPMAALWLDRFDKLATGHTALPSGPRPGGAMAAILQPLAPPARRW